MKRPKVRRDNSLVVRPKRALNTIDFHILSFDKLSSPFNKYLETEASPKHQGTNL